MAGAVGSVFGAVGVAAGLLTSPFIPGAWGGLLLGYALLELFPAPGHGSDVAAAIALSADETTALPSARRLRSITQTILPAKTYARVFEQVFNDIAWEYLDAIAESPAKARWVKWRGYFIFWQTVFSFLLSSTVGRMLRYVFSFTPPTE